jgi:hypothetical protein
MQTYQIDQTISGVTLGRWNAESKDAALDLMSQDQGYKDYDDLLSVTRETRENSTLQVSTLFDGDLVYTLQSNAGDGINGNIYANESDAERAAKAKYDDDWENETQIVPVDRADVEASVIRW